MLAFVNPFCDQTGKYVEVEHYAGGLDEIRKQVISANAKWDVVDFVLADFLRAYKEGLLEKIDHSILAPAMDGTPVEEDFFPGALPEYGAGVVLWSMIYAYNKGTFSGEQPGTIADFFDVKRFPGARGLRREPKVVLEWALLADNVPAEKVYAELSTPRGLDRAFAVLDRIKPSIEWWNDADEPIALLADNKVVMTSAWNGELHDAVARGQDRITSVWDGQIWDIDILGIIKGTRNLETAREFIRFVR
ncbi:extracellular solute-binding protein [Desulfococcaceae bacterium HSG7]|nr:extracellular solute-binding protein [Desulfococcaceae bacterium HSG7]